jgi:glucoamylase
MPSRPPSRLVPGTRVLAGTPDSDRQAAEQREWLAAGTVPGIHELGGSTMARDALLDLHVLSASDGVAVAGWAPPWQYVWPRDSALVATALARTGHPADAERVITFLQRVQPESGIFEARYRPDGTGVPDGRGLQSDSVGWTLWALDAVVTELPPASRAAFLERHRSLLDRSAGAALRLVANPRSLPPVSSDYWERRERGLTLATAAMVHAGLLAASELAEMVGDGELATRTAVAAGRVGSAIELTFGPDGYPRTAGGSAGSVDLGVSFLLPPFAGAVDGGVLEVWRRSAQRMARPAGGLAPGGSWRADGVSWNTATSSSAMTAAFVGDRDDSVARLRWLDAHRTEPGSLPEKVLSDGQPASVAPLAWAAATVLITVVELERHPS